MKIQSYSKVNFTSKNNPFVPMWKQVYKDMSDNGKVVEVPADQSSAINMELADSFRKISEISKRKMAASGMQASTEIITSFLY